MRGGHVYRVESQHCQLLRLPPAQRLAIVRLHWLPTPSLFWLPLHRITPATSRTPAGGSIDAPGQLRMDAAMEVEAREVSEGHTSPESTSTSRARVLLPASCEPPMPNASRKPLVWIVSLLSSPPPPSHRAWLAPSPPRPTGRICWMPGQSTTAGGASATCIPRIILGLYLYSRTHAPLARSSAVRATWAARWSNAPSPAVIS